MTSKEFDKKIKIGDRLHLAKWLPFQFIRVEKKLDKYFLDTFGFQWSKKEKWLKVKRLTFESGFIQPPVILQ